MLNYSNLVRIDTSLIIKQYYMQIDIHLHDVKIRIMISEKGRFEFLS